MIQKLSYKDDTYTIGLSEIANLNGLGVNQLLDLAKSHSEDVFVIQFFNSHLIASELHLLSAAQNALNAWSGGYMISRSPDVEVIVYASAQRQIHQALEIMGVKDGLATITVVVIDKNEENVTKVLEGVTDKIGEEIVPPFIPTEEKISTLMKVFDITGAEIQQFLTSDALTDKKHALTRCITSRVSLVAIGT